MKFFLISILLMTSGVHAQLRVNDIPAKDRKTTEAQGDQIFKALRAVNITAKEVVYPIYAGTEPVMRLAYGVSIGDDVLLVKASEVTNGLPLFSVNRAGVSLVAKVTGTYPDEDLAVVNVPGLNAPTAQWADAESLEEGAILAAIRPDGEVQAMGVLSVKERSLKAEDQGFLGIEMDPRESGDGVRVDAVVEGSAAAEVGLRVGDVITTIEGEDVRGFYELSTHLRRLKNGRRPEIEFQRGGETIKVTPVLKGRPVEEGKSRRLDRMDRMSGSQSRVRGEFSSVIQSDMELESKDSGLPVVDLNGRIVGMVIARAGRISTLILPGDDIEAVLRLEPQRYLPNPRVNERGRRVRGGGELMRRLLEEFQPRRGR